MLELGTVDDVFVVVGSVEDPGQGRAGLAALCGAAARLALEPALAEIGALRRLPRRPDLDVVGSALRRRSFNRYALEAAVGEAIAARTGSPYRARSADVAPAPAALSLRVHLDGTTATFALRLAARPLHRRAYRDRTRAGSTHAPLARTLALLAGLEPGLTLVDPCCGGGTIAIEAALAEPGIEAVGSDADAGRLPLAAGSVARVATNPP